MVDFTFEDGEQVQQTTSPVKLHVAVLTEVDPVLEAIADLTAAAERLGPASDDAPEVLYVPGEKVSYWSDTHKQWMDAVVAKQNIGPHGAVMSYELDVKRGAQPSRMRKHQEVKATAQQRSSNEQRAAEQCVVKAKSADSIGKQAPEPGPSTENSTEKFEVNDRVEYWSGTHKQWMHAVVSKVRGNDDTYDLDVKRGAHRSKMRHCRKAIIEQAPIAATDAPADAEPIDLLPPVLPPPSMNAYARGPSPAPASDRMRRATLPVLPVGDTLPAHRIGIDSTPDLVLAGQQGATPTHRTTVGAVGDAAAAVLPQPRFAGSHSHSPTAVVAGRQPPKVQPAMLQHISRANSLSPSIPAWPSARARSSGSPRATAARASSSSPAVGHSRQNRASLAVSPGNQSLRATLPSRRSVEPLHPVPARAGAALMAIDSSAMSTPKARRTLEVGKLVCVGASFDPTEQALKKQILESLGLGSGEIAAMQGFTGGLNEGVWFLSNLPGRGPDSDLVLKLVKCSRIAPSIPTEAENLQKLASDYPALLTDQSVGFPVKILSVLGAGNVKRNDLIIMEKVPGERMGELIAHKWYGKQIPQLMQIFEKIGHCLGEFHKRYGEAAQHGDFQPSNVFYDERNDHVSFIDIGGMGMPTSETDNEHYRKSLQLLSGSYGPELLVDGMRHFDQGYARARQC